MFCLLELQIREAEPLCVCSPCSQGRNDWGLIMQPDIHSSNYIWTGWFILKYGPSLADDGWKKNLRRPWGCEEMYLSRHLTGFAASCSKTNENKQLVGIPCAAGISPYSASKKSFSCPGANNLVRLSTYSANKAQDCSLEAGSAQSGHCSRFDRVWQLVWLSGFCKLGALAGNNPN